MFKKTYQQAPAFVQQLVDDVIEIEGEYSDNPHDRGGKTKYGITERVARQHGYTGDMKDLSLSLAQNIYVNTYFYYPNYDLISPISEHITRELFDSAVNIGYPRSSRILQYTLNALNRNQKDYLNIEVDGAIGGQTVGALKSFLSKRGYEGERVLYNLMNCQQGYFYLEIAEGDETQENNLFGWAAHRLTFL